MDTWKPNNYQAYPSTMPGLGSSPNQFTTYPNTQINNYPVYVVLFNSLFNIHFRHIKSILTLPLSVCTTPISQ